MPNRYRSGIRASVRGLWLGVFDDSQFHDSMSAIIDAGIRRAWRSAAAECGITPNEFTPDEKLEIFTTIFREVGFIGGFAAFIDANSKTNKGLLRTFNGRIAIWVNRYNDALNNAKIIVCDNLKYVWVLGKREHCKSCLKLNGKVKRGSYWDEKDIRPQDPPNDKLDCRGWNCGCGLEVTQDALSRGPLPGLP